MNDQLTFRGGWNLNVNPTVASYGFDSAAYSGVRTNGPGGVAQPFVPLGTRATSLVNVSLATPQFPGFTASIGGTFGNDVDFFETAAVLRTDYSASLDLRPSNQLRISATYVSSSFTRRSDGVRSAVTRIPRLKAEYQIARPLFVRVVAQYTATSRVPLMDPSTGLTLLVPDGTGGWVPSSQQTSNLLRADFLLSYRPSPGTVFFLGYGNSLTESRSARVPAPRTHDGRILREDQLRVRRDLRDRALTRVTRHPARGLNAGASAPPAPHRIPASPESARRTTP